jgi:hypothetical protein
VAFHVCDIRKGDLPVRTFDAVVHLASLADHRRLSKTQRPPQNHPPLIATPHPLVNDDLKSVG